MARRLFARVLDAPGGINILTIHAFCQALLKRFPLEAGVAPRLRGAGRGATPATLLSPGAQNDQIEALAQRRRAHRRWRDALAAVAGRVVDDRIRRADGASCWASAPGSLLAHRRRGRPGPKRLAAERWVPTRRTANRASASACAEAPAMPSSCARRHGRWPTGGDDRLPRAASDPALARLRRSRTCGRRFDAYCDGLLHRAEADLGRASPPSRRCRRMPGVDEVLCAEAEPSRAVLDRAQAAQRWSNSPWRCCGSASTSLERYAPRQAAPRRCSTTTT